MELIPSQMHNFEVVIHVKDLQLITFTHIYLSARLSIPKCCTRFICINCSGFYLQTEVLRQLSPMGRLVVATGSGSVVRSENW